jgi:hypothetical protein
MDRVFAAASFLCFVAAAWLLWTGHHSSTFVVATAGAVFWILIVRVRMRRIVVEADKKRALEAEEINTDDQ